MTVYVITTDDGRVAIAMGPLYDGENNEIAPDGYDGPYEVPDDFATNQHLYRLTGDTLALDQELVAEHKKRQMEIDRLNAQSSRANALIMTSQAQTMARAAVPDDVIALSIYFPEWTERDYALDDVITYEGQPFKCAQAHNSTGNPAWNPMDAPSLWANYHAQSKLMALPWINPTGAHDAYQSGEWMIWTDGNAYECIANNTVYGPDSLPGSWKN